MPNSDDIAALLKALESQDIWQWNTRKYQLATLHHILGVDLRGANLQRSDLSGADLSRAKLEKSVLDGANLSAANLFGADLTSASLKQANLESANLREAKLVNANLRASNLTRATFERAVLKGVQLQGANLTGTDLRGARLEGVNLEGVDLREAILNTEDLDGALNYDLLPNEVLQTLLVNNHPAAATFYARLKFLILSSHYDEAQGSLNRLLGIAPQNDQLLALRAELNNRKQAEVHFLLEDANASYQRADIDSALYNVKRVLQLDPGNQAATRLTVITSLLISANNRYHSGSYMQARAYLEELFQLDPGNNEALGLLHRITAAQEKERKEVEEETSKKAQQEMEQAEFRASEFKKHFALTLAYPKQMPKGHTTFFIVKLHPKGSSQAVRETKEVVDKHDLQSETHVSPVHANQTVTVKLSSQQVNFDDSASVLVTTAVVTLTFTGQPKPDTLPGKHAAVLSMTDKETDLMIQSIPFELLIVDYAFDHVSRPILSSAFSAVLAVGSFASFALTFLSDIDKTVGLASGTAAGVIAIFLIARYIELFKRPSVNISGNP